MEERYILKQGDCLELMKDIPGDSVDLTVTSPPYDNLRTYDGSICEWSFEKFKDIAKELFRITTMGGAVVWIVNDATIKGSETGTSFRQALYFKDIGFNLHDTMIWKKPGFTAVGALKTRYAPVFEYMFILSKGKLKTFNPIKDKPNIHAGKKKAGTTRNKDGSMKRKSNIGKIYEEYGQRYNVWEIDVVHQRGENTHPAPFPVQLASDHIVSWSNPNDVILDPFMGSGTTGIACLNANRKFIGFELNENYFNIAKQRIEETACNTNSIQTV